MLEVVNATPPQHHCKASCGRRLFGAVIPAQRSNLLHSCAQGETAINRLDCDTRSMDALDSPDGGSRFNYTFEGQLNQMLPSPPQLNTDKRHSAVDSVSKKLKNPDVAVSEAACATSGRHAQRKGSKWWLGEEDDEQNGSRMTIDQLNMGSSPLSEVIDPERSEILEIPSSADIHLSGYLERQDHNLKTMPRVVEPYNFPWPTDEHEETRTVAEKIATTDNVNIDCIKTLNMPPLLGRAFGNDWSLRNPRNRSTVLAQETIWCPAPEVIHKPMAKWPCWSEFQWEGDMRASSENGHFRRMLPLPRLPAHWPGYHPDYKENGVVPTSPFDKTFHIPTEEDVCAPVDEIPDDVAMHLIGRELHLFLDIALATVDVILEQCVRDFSNSKIDLRLSAAAHAQEPRSRLFG